MQCDWINYAATRVVTVLQYQFILSTNRFYLSGGERRSHVWKLHRSEKKTVRVIEAYRQSGTERRKIGSLDDLGRIWW
jgi:hypothetical protein